MSGKGGGGGYRFQAEAFAYVASVALCGQPLHWFPLLEDIPIAISMETLGPGDDLEIELKNGHRIELQAKRGASKGQKFLDAFLRLVKGLCEDESLYGVMLVDTSSSSTITNELSEDVERLGQGRRDSLKQITRDILRLLADKNICADADVFARLRIIVTNLNYGMDGHRIATTFLSRIVMDPAQISMVWALLVTEGLNLTSQAGRRNLKALVNLVSRYVHLPVNHQDNLASGQDGFDELLSSASRTEAKLIDQVDVRNYNQPGGAVTAKTEGGVDSTPGNMDSERDDLIAELSKEKAERIDDIRERFRNNNTREALRLIQEMQTNKSWEQISPAVRARALRVSAAFLLHLDRDLEKARSLAQDAISIDPEGDDSTINALIRFYEEGPEAALRQIDEPRNVDTYNLKIQSLLLLGRFEEALSSAENPPSSLVADAETKRLKAMALLVKGDAQAAEKEIHAALQQQPGWETVRYTSAFVNYFSALSTASMPTKLIAWPEPVHPELVRLDSESQDRLRAAAKCFHELATTTERKGDYQRILETWEMACLSNISGEQKKAGEFARGILEQYPAHHRVLLWAIVKEYEVNISASERALLEEISRLTNEFDPLILEKTIVLVVLLLQEKRAEDALSLLEKQKPIFVSAHAESRWSLWVGQILAELGRPEETLEIASAEKEPETRRELEIFAARELSSQSNNWNILADKLEEFYRETGEGGYLLSLCHLKYDLSDWSYISGCSEELLAKVQTPAAIRLVAFSSFHAGQIKKCRNLLDTFLRSEHEKSMAQDLVRLKVRCLMQIGAFA
ncbi:MAG TPA: hypothetical protein VLR90_05590, partial [Blastocatellia bacterium]|nr:hypothetical protein [Blastocatellia bacterium]